MRIMDEPSADSTFMAEEINREPISPNSEQYRAIKMNHDLAVSAILYSQGKCETNDRPINW